MEKKEAAGLLGRLLSGEKGRETGLEKLSPADRESLIDWALYYKVGGLLYRDIKSGHYPAEIVPLEAKNRLRDAYRSQATKNTSLFISASGILKALADRRLPVIALKGLALAKTIYGDIAVRPMEDIDLLVKEDDLVRAGRILLTLGYRQDFPAWESLSRTYHHLPAFTNKSGALIELHWNIVAPDSPLKVDREGLWERSRLIKSDNFEVRVFSAEDLFLHLCIHACFHLPTGLGLIPFCDLAGMIKSSADPIDWPIVRERAARWGGQKCVYLMLLLVRELLGAAAPAQIMSDLKPVDYQPAFFSQALELIYNVSRSGQFIGKRIGRLSKIKKGQGIKGKTAALLKAAFPSKEYLATIYPVSVSSPKIYLCYGFRLGRLLFDYSIVLLRLFRRDPLTLKAVRQENRQSAVSDWMYSSRNR